MTRKVGSEMVVRAMEPVTAKVLAGQVHAADPKTKAKVEAIMAKAVRNRRGANGVLIEYVKKAMGNDKALDRIERLVSTRGYQVLTAKQARTVLDAVVNAKTPKAAEQYFKAYHALLSDIPFCHQSRANRDGLLAHPFWAAKHTMKAIMGLKHPNMLPTEAEMEANVRAFLKEHGTDKFLNWLFKGPVMAAYEQIAKNRRTYWHFFAEHWYDTVRGGGETVGEAYARLGGRTWTDKVAFAQKQMRAVVSCAVDNIHHEECGLTGPDWSAPEGMRY